MVGHREDKPGPMRLRLAVLALALVAPLIAWADVTGPARAIDGDTIEVTGERGAVH